MRITIHKLVNGLLCIEDAKKKQQPWVANFVLAVRVIITMTKVSSLSFRTGRKTLKAPSFTHSIGLKILIMQAKKCVIIGSGATAITLVPAMAKGGAGHVTMLQRSPTYIASVPSIDNDLRQNA